MQSYVKIIYYCALNMERGKGYTLEELDTGRKSVKPGTIVSRACRESFPRLQVERATTHLSIQIVTSDKSFLQRDYDIRVFPIHQPLIVDCSMLYTRT
jgi:hypothetical protein